jgi:Flp pilus assembly protein TadG
MKLGWAWRYWHDEQGGAAAELGIFLLILVPIFLNLFDIGMYLYERTQVENAAQAGAQAAWATCNKPPATAANCPYLANSVASAVAGSRLGTRVSWDNSAGFPSASDAGYFCPDGANNALTAATEGQTCISTDDDAGYYAKIRVRHDFDPIFDGATVATLFTTPMMRETWIRIE